jgi:fibronectin type 3 domain-containing protein
MPSATSNNAAAKPARSIATYSDPLPADLQQQHRSQEATYAVEVLNDAGRSAGLSNMVHVPLASTLPPPRDFKAQVTADGVLLAWSGVHEQQASPGISHRYRIYRREQTDKNAALIAEQPLTGDPANTFIDHTSDWEKNYSYTLDVATVVSEAGKPPVVIDGDDTPAVSVFTHDTFPPSVPSGLQAVYSGPGQQPFIDLIWAPATNADLAGYNIYRSDSGEPAAKVNGDIVKTPAYKDAAIISGKQYTYWISAVDVRGNESARSEPASEKVP